MEVFETPHVKLYLGDCLEILPTLPPVDVIITDPPWPVEGGDYFGDIEPWSLFAAAAAHFPRLADRAIVILGGDSDPRFLGGMPLALPFLQICWMRRVPPGYKGTYMRGADAAYVFGNKGWLSVPGTRVLPGECTVASKGVRSPRRQGVTHPTPRPRGHLAWLVRNFTRPGQTILDPFAGTARLLEVCQTLDRRAIGVEVSEPFWREAVRGLGQGRLWGPAEPAPEVAAAPAGEGAGV